ncbi:MAG: UvrD-helicase domain-containing protein [Pseudolysinimonas sp.]|uniref:nuclease-related domain-containing DEAD/DEAH box helicase n=1 Tax=Pseudolysinimonas sp. TaxID=2680009 RepID=UPI003C732875
MAGGSSATLQADAAQGLADELRRQAAVHEQMVANYHAAAASERRLEKTLAPLRNHGYHVLADRQWPGSRKAQVDFLVVGPSGVFIVDAKSWRDVRIQRTGEGTRVFQGDDDVTDRFDGLISLGDTIADILEDIHLAPGQVRTLAVFTNRRDLKATVSGVELMSEPAVVERILSAGRRLSEVEVERVLRALTEACPPYAASATPASVVVSAPPAVAPAPEPQPEEPALLTVDEVQDAAYAGLAAEPIESWMAFLHPDQIRVVRRSFNGPSRIRGAAGTGKTVVGLHRAAHIARLHPGRVLVTTYVRTLPEVLRTLFRRLAPEASERVDFISIHAFARSLLRAHGITVKLDSVAADQIWNTVWRRHGAPGEVGAIDRDQRYWQDEIASVIKGRGLASLEEYENCSRFGRERRLTLPQRAAVWRLYLAYETELRAADVWDFADVILHAEATVTPGSSAYRAVVIDEAQDLSAAMIRLLHRLVGDEPDAFNLIGDGQQSIYPGGYTLGELGISIAGRGVVMTRNYRNTREIATFAASLVGDSGFVDIESGLRGRMDAAEVLREGAAPAIARFPTVAAHDAALVARVRELLATPGVHPGDVAVLAMHRWEVSSVVKLLGAAEVPVVDLAKYDGRVAAAVKVGTIKRAKGLEFKHVLVAHTPARLVGPAAVPENGQDAGERVEMERRELYVAMTRARDGLWVGVLAP